MRSDTVEKDKNTRRIATRTATLEDRTSNIITSNPSGKFVWHDLMTTDRDKAVTYYQLLFGWDLDQKETAGSGYAVMKSDGEKFAGVVSLSPSDGHTSHWISYISVDDVDSACNLMQAHGAAIPSPPFDMPGKGRTAIVKDPAGAYFSAFKRFPGNQQTSTPQSRIGKFMWHELWSTDIEESKSFYSLTIPWTAERLNRGHTAGWLFKKNGVPVAGVIQRSPHATQPSCWIPYVGVADVPATTKKSRYLGGKVCVSPQQLAGPADVHFAILAGPDNSMFGIFEV